LKIYNNNSATTIIFYRKIFHKGLDFFYLKLHEEAGNHISFDSSCEKIVFFSFNFLGKFLKRYDVGHIFSPHFYTTWANFFIYHTALVFEQLFLSDLTKSHTSAQGRIQGRVEGSEPLPPKVLSNLKPNKMHIKIS